MTIDSLANTPDAVAFSVRNMSPDVSPEDAPPPCGYLEDCNELPDGSYPDMTTNCTFYFTCLNGNDLGLQMCNTGKYESLLVAFLLEF